MTSDRNDIKITSFEQFLQEYYNTKNSNSNNKEYNRYYQTGLEAARLASEATLKALDLCSKSKDK